MGNGFSQGFDLPALLRIDGLDVRKVANNNISLHTGEYFDLLSKFIEQAPQLKEALAKDPSLNSAQDFKLLLENIGCDVSKIQAGFDSFSQRIIAAKKDKEPEVLTGILNADDTAFQSDESLLLQKTLKLLDHYEATSKIKILAVDDAPIILKTISSVLGDDYRVYGMTDPRKLERFLQQIKPALFLLDYKMPELSGFDLVPIIRSFDEHKKTPILFLTSSGTSELVSKAFALGACDYIVKPFQGKMLREKIGKHLGREVKS